MHEFGTLKVLGIFQGSNYLSPPRRRNDGIVGNLNKDVAGQPERGLSGEHPDYRRLKSAANIQSLRLFCGSHPFLASEAWWSIEYPWATSVPQPVGRPDSLSERSRLYHYGLKNRQIHFHFGPGQSPGYIAPLLYFRHFIRRSFPVPISKISPRSQRSTAREQNPIFFFTIFFEFIKCIYVKRNRNSKKKRNIRQKG